MAIQQMKEQDLSDKETYEYWLEGFKKQLGISRFTQKEISDMETEDGQKIVSQVHLNRIMTDKVGAGARLREKLAEIFGLSARDLINLGYEAITATSDTKKEEEPTAEREQSKPAIPITARDMMYTLRKFLQVADQDLAMAAGRITFLESLTEATTDTLTVVSAEGIITLQNHASIAAFGDHRGRINDEVMLEWDPNYEPDNNPLRLAFTSRQTTTFTGEVQGNNYNVHYIPIIGAAGQVANVLVKAAPSELSLEMNEERERANAVANSMEHGYVLLTQHKKVARYNTKFKELTGIIANDITFDDVLGRISRLENGGEVITHLYSSYDNHERTSGICTPKSGLPALWHEFIPLFNEKKKFLGVLCKLTKTCPDNKKS